MSETLYRKSTPTPSERLRKHFTPVLLLNRTMPGVEETSLADLITKCADGAEDTVLAYRAELQRIATKVIPNARREAAQKARNVALDRIASFEPALDRLETAKAFSEDSNAPLLRQQRTTLASIRGDMARAKRELYKRPRSI